MREEKSDMGNRLVFVTCFWGERFRRYFLEYFISSLLAPHNLPHLSTKLNAELRVYVPKEDWVKVQKDTRINQIKKFVKLTHSEIQTPTFDENKYAIMSSCHLDAAKIAMDEKSACVFLCCDSLLADGFIKEIAGKLDDYPVVLAPAIRHSAEALLPLVENFRQKTANKIIEITPKEFRKSQC